MPAAIAVISPWLEMALVLNATPAGRRVVARKPQH